MGDAGYILAGPIGREVLAFGTVVFAIFATGGYVYPYKYSPNPQIFLSKKHHKHKILTPFLRQLLAGQIALASLSDNKLCLMLYTGIFAIPTLLLSFPRTLDQLSWLSIPSVISIMVAGIVGMAGAGANPVAGRQIDVAVSTSFYSAFVSITNPVFSYAGHFMFFILVSEMKRPQGQNDPSLSTLFRLLSKS